MSEAIVICLITSACTLIANILVIKAGNDKVMKELEKHNAVQDERIKTLTDRVEKHNSIVERTYILEGKVTALENK